ncbi:MAG: cytochrome P450 [Pseudomonadota bacterium]
MTTAPINLFDPATLLDPYDAYRTLRDTQPVYPIPAMNIHVVTRYDLIREAIKDTDTYSSRFEAFMARTREAGIAQASPAARAKLEAIEAELIALPPTMLTLDQPEHTEYRSLVSQLFTGSEVKRSEPQVLAVIEACLKSMLSSAVDGCVDFVEHFAFPVPLRIIADRLGIPEPERAFFDEAAAAAASTLRMAPLSDEELIHRAELARDLQKLLCRLIDERRQQPTDDMISILANSTLEKAGRALTYGEAISILNQFLVAGHETTASTFGWAMLALCQQHELQDQIRGDEKRIRTFVEEALRIESPVQGLPRRVTKDTELGGYPLNAGDFIMLRFGAGNRDERQFPDPDQIDITRDKAGMQLAFGSGVHHCIGAPLARQELNLGFRALLKALHNIRLATDQIPKAEPSFILRNLPTLPIRFDRRTN